MDQPLPNPVTVADFYLAAILEELRALRAAIERPVTVLSMPAETDFLGGGPVAPPAPRSRRRKTPGG